MEEHGVPGVTELGTTERLHFHFHQRFTSLSVSPDDPILLMSRDQETQALLLA